MTTRARANYEFTAQDRTRGAVRSIETSMQRLDRSFKQLGGTIATALGGRQTFSVLDRTSAELQKLEQAASRLDFPVDQLQGWFIAARQAGADTGSLATAIQRMTRRISEADAGSESLAAAFGELGLNESALEALNTAEAFEEIIRQLDQLSSDDYIRLNQKIFDSEGVQVIADTTAAMEGLRGELDDYILSEEQLASAAYLRDYLDGLATSFQSWKEQFTAGIGELLRLWNDFFADETELSLQGTRDELEETNKQVVELINEIRRLEAEDPDFYAGRIERLGVGVDNLRDKIRRLQQQEIRLETLLNPPIPIRGEIPDTDGIPGEERLPNVPTFDPGLMGLEPQMANWTQFLDESTVKTEDNTRALIDMDSAARDLGFTFTSAFEDAIVSGENLSEVLKGLAQDIARIGIRTAITEPLAGAIRGGIQNQFGSGSGSGGFSFSDLFGAGTRSDSGGRVSAGELVSIGTGAQPELFVPDTPGTMVPNGGAMLGGDTYNVNISAVDARGVYQVLQQDPRSFAGMVRTSFARRGSRVDVG